jgi:hypothetical protein
LRRPQREAALDEDNCRRGGLIGHLDDDLGDSLACDAERIGLGGSGDT